MTPAFLLLVGCGGDLSPYLPTVTFDRLELTAIDFERIDVDFVFDVHNPNPVGVPVQRFGYALALEGFEILSGEGTDQLRLDPEATSEIALPVGLDFSNVYDAIQATRGVDVVGFELQGGFGFDTDIGPVDIAFAEQGDFPALRVPEIQLSTLVLESYDEDAVSVGLDLVVDNDHGSTLDFSALDFDVKFAGVRVGGGKQDEVGSVDGASSRTLTIPFTVDYDDAAEAYDAVQNGEPLTVEMDAAVDVDTPFGIVPLTIDEKGNIDVREE